MLLYAGKSDNVNFLLDLDHRSKTIIQWSVAPATQSRLIERGTAPMERRIEAARKCQEAGYLVRLWFSPIIPVNGWREEYARMITELFAATQPDVIALHAFGWTNIDEMTGCIDPSLLDPWAVELARERRGEVEGRKYRPFPHEVRRTFYRFLIDEIRRHSPATPISLCLESPEMWREFGDELGRMADGYLCTCGPTCSPGTAFYESRQAFAQQRT